MDYKLIIGFLAAILAVVGYGPYIRDIFRLKTTPHAFTWFVWTLAASITLAIQLYGGAGWGAASTLTVVFICVAIFFLSLRYGSKNIARSDVLCLLLALISLGLWLMVDQPFWSVILIVTTDVLGFIPAVRKSWINPYSETLWSYQVSTVRYALSILALEHYNIFTLLYPTVWVIVFSGFCTMLFLRRRMMNPV